MAGSGTYYAVGNCPVMYVLAVVFIIKVDKAICNVDVL